MLWLGKLFQDWLVVFREGNERAMRGAEQMVKVVWHRVTPAWEQPPDWQYGPPDIPVSGA